jgi:hypothetical protein
MCAAEMWRYVRAWRSACPAADGPDGDALGGWAATVVRSRRGEVIVSIETQTYLTVLCELTAESTFPGVWTRALRTSLEDMRVPAWRIARALVRARELRLEPLEDDTLSQALAVVEFVCETELYYEPDLRVAQRRLNEFPHDHPPDYAPMVAVRRLFGVRA